MIGEPSMERAVSNLANLANLVNSSSFLFINFQNDHCTVMVVIISLDARRVNWKLGPYHASFFFIHLLILSTSHDINIPILLQQILRSFWQILP